jgi:hypothetical protein
MRRHPWSVYNGKVQTFTSWIQRLGFEDARSDTPQISSVLQ